MYSQHHGLKQQKKFVVGEPQIDQVNLKSCTVARASMSTRANQRIGGNSWILKMDFVECSPPLLQAARSARRPSPPSNPAGELAPPRPRRWADVGSKNPEPGDHVATQELGESRVDEEAPPEGGRCPADPPPVEGRSKAGVPFPASSGAAAGAGPAAARGLKKGDARTLHIILSPRHVWGMQSEQAFLSSF